MASIRQRVEKIEEEIYGVSSLFGVTSWERSFMENIKTRTVLTEKQAEVLREIEEKVFGDEA